MNLRKDHYRRSSPRRGASLRVDQLPLAAARARGSVSADLARRPKASQSRAAEGAGGGELVEWRRRRRLSNRPAWPRPPRGVGDGGRLRALLLLLLSFFHRPPSKPKPRRRARLRPGPRAPAHGRVRSEPKPQARPRRRGAGRLTGIAELASLLRSAWAGCSKSPPPATATAGRPEVVASITLFFPNLVSELRLCNENQKEQLLAVDHSAHASMKNAASCEK